MRRNPLIAALAALVVIVVSLVILVVSGRAPALSSVGTPERPCGAASCLTFPMISGQNLPGDSFNLPGDFKGKTNLVLVPFDEDQQVRAQSWLPFARQLASADADFRSYNVPVFPNMAAPMRAVIRTGMAITISEAALRSVTITVFLEDRDAFLKALDIPNADAMPVFLLNGQGVVLWRGTGAFTDEQGAALRALVSG